MAATLVATALFCIHLGPHQPPLHSCLGLRENEPALLARGRLGLGDPGQSRGIPTRAGMGEEPESQVQVIAWKPKRSPPCL